MFARCFLYNFPAPGDGSTRSRRQRSEKAIDVRLGDIRDAGVGRRGLSRRRCCPPSRRTHRDSLLVLSLHVSFVDHERTPGTLNVLEAATSKPGFRAWFSYVDEYGMAPPVDLPIRETHPLNAQSPYAATKIAVIKNKTIVHCNASNNFIITNNIFQYVTYV